jgi:hypothetical protein
MPIRRSVVALALVCLIGETTAARASAQSLGAAAAAAAKQREAAGRQPATTPPAERKPAADAPEPAASDAKPRKVYKQDDLPGYAPQDRARAEGLKSIDERYKLLLRHVRQLEAKTKEDVQRARAAEMELKIFNLDLANRRKVEQRQALQDKCAQLRVIVQHNLVILEGLRADQRALDAELQRVRAR